MNITNIYLQLLTRNFRKICTTEVTTHHELEITNQFKYENI